MEEEVKRFEAEDTDARPSFGALFHGWSCQKKLFAGLGGLLWALCMFVPLAALSISMWQKWGTDQYETIFRILAQCLFVFTAPVYLLFYIVFFWRFRQHENSFRGLYPALLKISWSTILCLFDHGVSRHLLLRNTGKNPFPAQAAQLNFNSLCAVKNLEHTDAATFAFNYAPGIAAEKYWQAWRHARMMFICPMAFYFSCYTGYCLMPIYEYVSMYPHVNHNKLHLFFGDQDFGLDRSKYFWYVHVVVSLGGYCVVGVGLISYAIPSILCTLVEGQIQILVESLKALGIAEEQKEAYQNVKPSRPWATSRHKMLQKGATRSLVYPAYLKKGTSTLFWKIFSMGKKDSQKRDFSTNVVSRGGRSLENKELTFRNCTIHHQKILRMIRQIQFLIAPILCIKIMTTVVSASNNIVIMSSGGTYMPRMLLGAAVASIFGHLLISVWCLAKLRDASSSVSDAACLLVRYKNIPRKHLIITITRSLHPVTFPCYLTSALSFKDIYRLIDLSWNYFTIAEIMAKKHPEVPNTG